MAKNIAGRILIMPKGTYDANATYEFLDLVLYNNASWLAKKTATGIEPADGEYWHKMADGVELVANLTEEAEGKALDASMGKVLKDLIDAVGADALRERLDALEATSATHSEDIEALRLAIEEFGNVDNATAGYNAETDSLWVLKGDEKVDVLKLYSERHYLIKDGLNHGNLHVESSTGIAPTISYEGDYVLINLTSVYGNAYPSGTLAFDEIDVTNYDRLIMHQVSSTNNSNATYNTITIGVKDSLGTILVADQFFANVANNNDDVVLDVSNVQGKVKVYLYMNGYYNSGAEKYVEVKIANLYAE